METQFAEIRWPNCGLVCLSYLANGKLPNAMAPRRLESLKSADGRQPYRERLARRDVVVAVGARPIMAVEQVFDIELDAPVLIDLPVQRGVEADEAGQPDRVIRGRKGIGAIDLAHRRGPEWIDLVFVPPGELIGGNELHPVAGYNGGGGVAADPRVGIGITER